MSDHFVNPYIIWRLLRDPPMGVDPGVSYGDDAVRTLEQEIPEIMVGHNSDRITQYRLHLRSNKYYISIDFVADIYPAVVEIKLEKVMNIIWSNYNKQIYPINVLKLLTSDSPIIQKLEQ